MQISFNRSSTVHPAHEANRRLCKRLVAVIHF
jgi:hypothetical protein